MGAYPEGGPIYVGSPDIIPTLRPQVVSCSTVVGFNIKFDLHWLQRYGLTIGDRRVWDCQLAHFLLTGQREVYPSLDEVLAYYNLPPKDPTIERDYWSKGIDTPDIPQDLMIHYLCRDLEATMEVYQRQQVDFRKNPQLFRLFSLSCQDLLVLQEMEWNGLKLDVERVHAREKELSSELEAIETRLNGLYPHIPINWNSVDDVSSILYGGTVVRERREVIGVYKTGAKIGMPRYRVLEDVHPVPRLCEPLPNSELAKEGYWSTDEQTLKQLKGAKHVVADLLARAKLSKELDYFKGLPKLIEEKDWDSGMLHGQLNQCVAATGRLSASAPNQQNLSEAIKSCMVSRY